MNPLRPLILSQPAVIAALGVAFIMTVGTAVLGVVGNRQVVATNGRIAETHETILTLQQVLTAAADAETGQKGYLLTGDRKYLQPYRLANDRLDPLLDALRNRYAAVPDKREIIDRLGPVIASKREEMEKTIALRGGGSVAAALNIVESDDGRSAMESIRRELNGLEVRELGELKEEGNLLTERARQVQFMIVGSIGLAVLLTGLAALLMARRVQELATMVTVCAWTKRVKWKGKWVSFEEFLEQRFKLRFTHGISEEAARQFQVEAYEVHEAHALRVPPKKPVAK